MKSILKSSLVVAALFPAIAFAADGAINFTGSVVASTCTYTGTSGNAQTVTLPPVSASALSTVGSTAGDTRFDILLASCGRIPKNVAINLEGGFDPAGNLRNTAGTNAAANVGVQLRNRNTDTVIQVPGPSAAVTSATDGTASIPLLAKYVANGSVTAGNVVSSVNFSIIYP